MQARATLDTNGVLIGDPVRLELRVEHDPQIDVVFPAIGDTIGGLDVLERSAIDSAYAEGILAQRQTLTVAAYDSGSYAIPAYAFTYSAENDTQRLSIETYPLTLEVYTVEVDTAQPIKDIKSPLLPAFTFDELLPYIGIGLGIAALIAALYYWRRRKTSPEPVVIRRPKKSPYQIALDSLYELDEDKLWQQGKIKLYYVRLGDIIRVYIEGRFGITAMEQTTDEILTAIETAELSADLKSELRGLLTLADLVKFAKASPAPDENEKNLQRAFDFVRGTRTSATTEETSAEGAQE